MKRNSTFGTLAIGAVLALAGCGGASGAASPGHPSTPVTAAGTPAGLHVADTSLGPILVDGKGMTVYLLTSDRPNRSRCNSQCLQYWPLVPASQGSDAEGVTATVSRARATDGEKLATVGGWPLYTYVQDRAPGDVTGQGVKSFGGVWYAISPSGRPVKGPARSPAGTGGGGYGY